MRPLMTTILGGAAVLALSAGAAFAAADTSVATATTRDGKTERRIVMIREDGPGPMGPMRHEGPMGRHGHDPQKMAKRLRDVLQLTPAQEPALQAFVTAMAPPPPPPPPPGAPPHRIEMAMGPDGKPDMAKLHEQMERMHDEMGKRHAEDAALTTPERLDRRVKAMTEESARHQAEMMRHVEAVKRFYAALTPSQQKAFDALHAGMGEHRRPGPMMGRGRMMGMGPEQEPQMMAAFPPPPPPAPPAR